MAQLLAQPVLRIAQVRNQVIPKAELDCLYASKNARSRAFGSSEHRPSGELGPTCCEAWQQHQTDSEWTPNRKLQEKGRRTRKIKSLVSILLSCNLLRPLVKILLLLVPYGYIILKIKKNS